jgi:Uma2 family endonuclease
MSKLAASSIATAAVPTSVPVTPVELTPEQRLVLYGVSWETYVNISEALTPHPSVKLTYDQGALEIMTTSFPHENLKKVLGLLVELIAGELELDFIGSGGTTYRRERQAQGFEGDESFFFTKLDDLRQRSVFTPEDDAPDLIIEVDISSPSLSKFPLFAERNIHEVWRWHKGWVTIYELVGQQYEERTSSHFLRGLTVEGLNELLAIHGTMPAYVWQRRVREYARQCQQA